MRVKGKQTYENVINIPEQRICKGSGEDMETWAIEHRTEPAGKQLETCSMRTRMFGGHNGKPVTYDHETRWHYLTAPEGLWMSDVPTEQWEHDEYVKDGFRRGRILIGGLGLGYIATVLAQRPNVKEVVVVEITPEIIKLVEPYLLKDNPEARKKVTVVQADLFEFLKTYNGVPFEYAFYDIWQLDGESSFFKYVAPLLSLSSPKVVKNRPMCWRENIMRGQIFMGLQSRYAATKYKDHDFGITLEELATDSADIWKGWSAPFFQWVKEKSPDDQTFQQGASYYAKLYGTYDWKDNWEYVKEALIHVRKTA